MRSKAVKIALSILIIICFLPYFNALGVNLYDQTEKNLPTRGYVALGINTPEDNFETRITIGATDKIDLFVVDHILYGDFLNKTEFEDLTNNEHLGITYASFEVTLPTKGEYWVIIDNTDTHGYQSEGIIDEIRVVIEVFDWAEAPPFDPESLDAPELEEVIMFVLVVVFFIIPIIITLLSLLIYFLSLKKKTPISEIVKTEEIDIKKADKVEMEERFHFQVFPPGISWFWILILFLLFFIGFDFILNLIDLGVISMFQFLTTGYQIWSIIAIISPIISLITWGFLGIPIAKYTILKSLNKWKQQKRVGLIHRLLGLKLERDTNFYLEISPVDLNLKKTFSVFRHRILEIMAMSLGIATILTRIILMFNPPDWSYLVYQYEASSNKLFQLQITTYLTIITPILLFFIVPIIWIAEDIHISGLSENKTLVKLQDYIRGGVLDKILGIAGLILLFDTIQGLNEQLHGENNLLVYFQSALNILWFISFSCAFPLIIGFLYFYIFHQKAVNTLRYEALRILPLGSTTLFSRQPLKNSNHIEETELSQKSNFSSFLGKLGLFLIWYYFISFSILYLFFPEVV